MDLNEQAFVVKTQQLDKRLRKVLKGSDPDVMLCVLTSIIRRFWLSQPEDRRKDSREFMEEILGHILAPPDPNEMPDLHLNS